MNKKLLLFLMSITLFFLIPDRQQDVWAIDNSNDYLVVTENPETRLHSGANDEYKVKTVIPKNQKVVVIGELVNKENEKWFRVQFNNGIGWIKNTGLKRLEIKGQLFTSSSVEAPIRKGATTTYKQVDSLQKGQIVKVMEGFTNGDGEKWIQVLNGKVAGWIPLSSLELFNEDKNYLNKSLFIIEDTGVKRGAASGEKTTYTIKKGTQITVQSTIIINNETWYRIKDGKRSGWILASHATNQLNQSVDYFVKNQSADVRRGALSSYKVVSTLSIGQKVKSTALFINGKNEIWYKVVLGNGKSGWVLGTSLSTKKVKIAYITVDDGPTSHTSQLLNILNQYNAKATFFMVNGKINAYPNAVQRTVKEGHAVGSHSVTHDKNKFYRSPTSAVNEMMTTRNSIKKITGVSSNLMRVPYGSVPFMKKGYRDEMNKQHLIMWDWNIDSLDWKFNNSSYVNHTINQVNRVEKSGGIPYILIHDRKATVDHLPKLLSALEKKGYTFAPISESIKPYQFSVR